MLEIGKTNKLKVVKKVDFGLYLDGEESGEILIPTRYVPQNCSVDDFIDVFIYNDSEDRLIATTEIPFAQVGEFAFLKVLSVNQFGAFLDWGLSKDLLVPFREQKMTMEEGKKYIVYVYLDLETKRIAASSKIEKCLSKETPDFTEGLEVNLLIWTQTEIGFKAIINNKFQGILYKNEIFQNLERGQKIPGFIKKIRDDGKIDLTLSKPELEKIDDLTKRILILLKENGGFLAVNDKSSTEIVYSMFQESKKAFKIALGSLYKKRLIVFEDNGIRIIEPPGV
jgi:uncharacterized protein